LLCELRGYLWRILCLFSFRVNDRLFGFGSDHFASKLVAFKLWYILDEQTLKNVSAIHDRQNTIAYFNTINEGSIVNEAVLKQHALTFWDTSIKITSEFAAIFIENSAFTMWQVTFERSLDHVTVFET
jgi:hypothetical protein